MGYDGSEQAERALDFAIELASHETDSEIHVAYVVQKPGGIPDPVPSEVMDALTRTGNEALRNAERTVRKSLQRAVVHLEVGSPAERLFALATTLEPDLVVLGTLRPSAPERLPGSVPSRFLKSRRYPLLVVP